MRTLIVPILYHLVLAMAGRGVLQLAGVKPRGVGNAIALTCLGYLLGIASVFAILELLLVIGVPFALPTIFVVALAVAAPWLITVPAAVRGLRLPEPRALLTYPVVAGVVITGVFILVFVHQLDWPILNWDAWSDWTYKARIFEGVSHIPVALFESFDKANIPGLGLNFPVSHFDYPLTLPLFEAGHFRAVGRADTSQVTAIMMLWIPGWIGGMVALAPRNASKLVVYPLTLGTAILLLPYMTSGLADAPIAAFLSLGVLALGRWLIARDRSDLILGVVLMGGAAGLKNEGTVGGVVIFLALLLGLLRDREGLRSVVLAGVAWVVAFIVPWKIWVVAHGIKGDLPFGKALDPGYVIGNFDRFKPIGQALADTYRTGVDISTVSLVAIAVLFIAKGPSPRVRAYAVLALVFYGLTLLAVYLLTPYDLGWFYGNSTRRILVPFSVIGVSSILLLATPPGPPGDPRDDEQAAAQAADAGDSTTPDGERVAVA